MAFIEGLSLSFSKIFLTDTINKYTQNYGKNDG